TSTDPDRPATPLQVTLAVTDAPAIAVAPALVDFGVRFAGTLASRSLAIANAGTTDLTVTAIVPGDPTLTIEESGAPIALPWVLPPGGTRTLVVDWSPFLPGPLDTVLSIASDAANGATGAATPRLRGTAILPPRLVFGPASFDVALDAGTATTRTLTIENPGGSDLTATVAAASDGGWLTVEPMGVTVPAGAGAAIEVRIDAANRPAGPTTGSVTIDTNDPFRPHAELPVGLVVGDAPRLTVTVPPEVLESRAAFRTAGASTAHTLHSRHPAAGDGIVTAMVEGDFGNPVERASFVFEGVSLGAAGGVGGDCVTVTRAFPIERADLDTDLADGRIEASVTNAGSVDPDCPANRHTVRLTYPLSQEVIDFGPVLPGETRHRTLVLANPGSRDLEVSRIAATGPGFAAAASARPAGTGTGLGDLRLTPGQGYALDLTFGGMATAGLPPGPLEGGLAITSDDPHEPMRTLVLRATLGASPAVDLAPGGLEVALLEGHTEDRVVTLANQGDQPVDLVLGVEGTPTATSAACPGRAVFVAAYDLGRISQFDPAGGAGSIAAAGLFGPRALAVDPSGRRLLAIEFDGHLASVDLATGSISRLRPGLELMEGLALDPDGRGAWVTAFGHGTLAHVDLVTGDVEVAAVDLAAPHGVAVDRSGRSVYVVEGARDALVRVDPATGGATLVADGLDGATGVAIDQGGGQAFVTLQSRGAVAVIDLATGAVRDLVTGLAAPTEIARDPETGLLLVSTLGGAGASVIDPVTGVVTTTLTGVAAPTGVAWRAPSVCRGRFLHPLSPVVTVPAHGAVDTTVRFDASGLGAGVWRADLVAGPAGFFTPLARTSVALQVAARPHLMVTGKDVLIDSLRGYNTSGAKTVHTLPVDILPGTDGSVELTLEGDFGNGRERAFLALEGQPLGDIGGTGDCQASVSSFAASRAALLLAAADGTMEFTVQNTPDVDPTCSLNRHRIRLRYQSADPAAGVDFGPV
ncbi:MAG TPA: choice-of-anchor D domain-containing protein, partial [Candidatus Polarisedimenticolia bacterium]|nr:choice-of-anchor D domain-containing protein [Candidatus Polarisedimenticolia bacterium]